MSIKRNLSLAVVDLMNTAHKRIAYPKIRLQYKGLKLQLALAGEKSRYKGSITVTNGGPFGDNIYYGRIDPNGTTEWKRNFSAMQIMEIEQAISQFADNPVEYAKLYSQDTGNCMFCAKELTDPQSVLVGYGPVCAETYGLPHGNINAKDAQAAVEVEHDLADFKLEPVESPVADIAEEQMNTPFAVSEESQLRMLEERVTALEAIIYRMQSNGE